MECHVPVILKSCKNHLSKGVIILLGQPVDYPALSMTSPFVPAVLQTGCHNYFVCAAVP